MNRNQTASIFVVLAALSMAVLLVAAPVSRAMPSGTMKLNGGALATNSLTVTVDSSVTGATTMRFGTIKDGAWLWTGWRTYAASSALAIYGADGSKAVCADYKDAAGNVFRPPYAYIILDRVPPSGTMKLNGGALVTNSLTVTVDSSVTGATTMRFGTIKDGAPVWTDWRAYAATSPVTIYGLDGSKMVCADYRDAAGNVLRTPYAYITLDTTPPSGTMTLNGGASATISLTVTVNSSVTGANAMRFATIKDGAWVWTGWRTYAASSALAIYGADGSKVVCAEYKDTAGNRFRPPYAYITLDRLPPSGTVTLNGGAFVTNSLTVTVNSSIVGASLMRFATIKDGAWLWSDWQTYAASSALAIYGADGSKVVCAEYKDTAGNRFRPPYAYIVLDTVAPSITGISSTTQPVSDLWYNNSSAVLSWVASADRAGIAGYSVLMDRSATTTPDTAIDTTSGASVAIGGLENGVWVFHVRACDNAGNWGPQALRYVRIDTGPPVTTESGAGNRWHSTPVTVTFAATDAGSGVQRTEYSLDGGLWTTGTRVTVLAPFTNSRVTHTLLYRSIDNVGFVEAPHQCTVLIDTRDVAAPTVKALVKIPKFIVAKRGHTAVVRFRIDDAQPSSGWASVKIKIVTGSGATQKTFHITKVSTNADQTFRFHCTLPVKHYGVFLSARDFAGHPSAKSRRPAAYLHVVR